MRSLRENLKLRPCRIDRAIARPTRSAKVWDFLVTAERSRLLSCLLYGTNNKSKAKSWRSWSDHYIRRVRNASASLFIHRFQTHKRVSWSKIISIFATIYKGWFSQAHKHNLSITSEDTPDISVNISRNIRRTNPLTCLMLFLLAHKHKKNKHVCFSCAYAYAEVRTA